MNTPREKVSYCLGLETGKSLKNQFAEIDLNLLKEGFNDALNGAQSKIPLEEVRSIMSTLKQQIEQQQKEFYIKLADHNKKEGESFLLQNKNKAGVVSLASGLQYKVLQEGKGAMPHLVDTVSAHTRGYFIDGRVFENSYEREQPIVFPVNRVIPAWSEALQMMHVGDKWQLFLPPYLAYGEMGFGNEIGPNTTLIFELELLGIN